MIYWYGRKLYSKDPKRGNTRNRDSNSKHAEREIPGCTNDIFLKFIHDFSSITFLKVFKLIYQQNFLYDSLKKLSI